MVEGGDVRIARIAEIVERLGASELVRLQAADFAGLAGLGRTFVHFNLGHTSNMIGRRYAIVPIVTRGRRLQDGREILPVVDPSRFRVAECLHVARGLTLEQIPEEVFAHSLPTIRTVAQLRQVLFARYRDMHPGQSPDEIVARGCSMTRFAMDEPAW